MDLHLMENVLGHDVAANRALERVRMAPSTITSVKDSLKPAIDLIKEIVTS